jgi:hypothetical protein
VRNTNGEGRQGKEMTLRDYVRAFGAVVFVLTTILVTVASSVIPASYNLVENNGTPLTRRSTINCTGALTCSDSGGVTVFNATGGSSGANYSQSFTSQTSVALAHGLGTTAVVWDCYNNGTPPVSIIPNTVSITNANTMTVTFSVAQSGTCVVNGSGGGGGGSGTLTPSAPYITDGTNYYAGISAALTRPSGSFSWVNQRTITETLVNGAAQWVVPDYGGGGPQITARMANLSIATPYTATACMAGSQFGNLDMDLLVSDGTQFITFGYVANSAGGPGYAVSEWTSFAPGSVSSPYFNAVTSTAFPCMRISDDGTNMNFYAGTALGPPNWILIYSQARAVFLTATQWGYGVNYNTNVSGTQLSQITFLSASQVTP